MWEVTYASCGLELEREEEEDIYTQVPLEKIQMRKIQKKCGATVGPCGASSPLLVAYVPRWSSRAWRSALVAGLTTDRANYAVRVVLKNASSKTKRPIGARGARGSSARAARHP